MPIERSVWPKDSLNKYQAEAMVNIFRIVDNKPIPAVFQTEDAGHGRVWLKNPLNELRRECYNLWQQMSLRAKVFFYLGYLNGGLSYVIEIIESIDDALPDDPKDPEIATLGEGLVDALKSAYRQLQAISDDIEPRGHTLIEGIAADILREAANESQDAGGPGGGDPPVES